MNIEFRDGFQADLHGFSTVVTDQQWGRAGVGLMDRMWGIVKGRQLGNKGINIWVYEPGNKLFAGVELTAPAPADAGLEAKQVRIGKCVVVRYVGPYDKIGETCARLVDDFHSKGINTVWPYIEVYGHASPDPEKAETDLIWTLG